MTTSLGKRSSTNGISDIAYSDEKAPVYTSTNQFVQGSKTYNDPQKFLSNVLCSGYYYGDGSHLINLPIVNDPSKLPLAGGTMTGNLVMSGGSTITLDTGLGNTITMGNNQLNFTSTLNNPSVLSNSSGQDMNLASSANLNLSATGIYMTGSTLDITVGPTNITATGGPLNLTADGNITLSTPSLANINLNAFNVDSYGFAMPMCFEFGEVDRQYTYNSGGQAWEQIWQQDLYLPTQFFTEAPNSGYTSRKWRIDFTINTWNNGSGNNSQDKATAYYIALEDQAGTFYYPVVITPQTPFCRHNNNSTWSGGGPNSEFQPFSWTDIIDLQGISGSYGNLLPLRFKVYFAADNPKDFHFSYLLGLTRTNNI